MLILISSIFIRYVNTITLLYMEMHVYIYVYLQPYISKHCFKEVMKDCSKAIFSLFFFISQSTK